MAMAENGLGRPMLVGGLAIPWPGDPGQCKCREWDWAVTFIHCWLMTVVILWPDAGSSRSLDFSNMKNFTSIYALKSIPFLWSYFWQSVIHHNNKGRRDRCPQTEWQSLGWGQLVPHGVTANGSWRLRCIQPCKLFLPPTLGILMLGF